MNYEFSREEILSRLQKEVFANFQDYLRQTVSEETNRMDELLQKTNEAINAGQTDQALKKLIETVSIWFAASEKELDDESEDAPSLSWLQHLDTLTSELEEHIHLPQQEERFRAISTDSPFIKTGKLVKRLGRGSQKIGHAVGSIFKEGSAEAPVWRQNVPLRNLIQFYLLEAYKPMQNWEHQYHKLQAEVLLETDAWTLHSSGLIHHTPAEKTETHSDGEPNNEAQEPLPEAEPDQIPDQEDMEIFFEEAVKELHAIHKKFENALQDQMQTIIERVTSALSTTGTIETSASDFDQQVIVNKKQRVVTETGNHDKKWLEILTALLNRCRLSIDFIELYKQSKERMDGFSTSLDEFFTQNFETPAQTLLQQLESAREIFEDLESEKKTKKQIQELSQQHQQKMTEHIENNLTKPIGELIQDAVLGTKLE
ncbi:MAG TPA: hypothetical protein DD671_20220, partial [Balneolaceae bacterium]|nr:hypothetical protein [Balneolaceae bacterium]